MKKIIALALALVMALSLGVVALADCDFVDVDGRECGVEYDDTYPHMLPGEKYWFENDYAKDLNITVEWTKGGALVKGVYYEPKSDEDTYPSEAFDGWDGWDDIMNDVGWTNEPDDETGVWVIELKENYTITTAKDLEGTVTYTYKDADGKKKTAEMKIWGVVSNHILDVYGEEDKDDALVIEAENNTLYQCEEDEAGYVKFNKGALLSATLNMASEEKAFMYNDEAAIDALTEKFPEADIECYNFGGSPVFKNEAEFTLQADYADQYYVYTYTNGKLEAQDYTWNSIEGVYEWATKAPTSYVISDVELVAADEAEETKNPDTGANDVVGVAAALAVVSLVAAGAVSLKK